MYKHLRAKHLSLACPSQGYYVEELQPESAAIVSMSSKILNIIEKSRVNFIWGGFKFGLPLHQTAHKHLSALYSPLPFLMLGP